MFLVVLCFCPGVRVFFCVRAHSSICLSLVTVWPNTEDKNIEEMWRDRSYDMHVGRICHNVFLQVFSFSLSSLPLTLSLRVIWRLNKMCRETRVWEELCERQSPKPLYRCSSVRFGAFREHIIEWWSALCFSSQPLSTNVKRWRCVGMASALCGWIHRHSRLAVVESQRGVEWFSDHQIS